MVAVWGVAMVGLLLYLFAVGLLCCSCAGVCLLVMNLVFCLLFGFDSGCFYLVGRFGCFVSSGRGWFIMLLLLLCILCLRVVLFDDAFTGAFAGCLGLVVALRVFWVVC